MQRFSSLSAFAVAAWLLSEMVAPASSETAEAAPDLAGRTALLADVEQALESGEVALAERLMARFRTKYPPSSGVKGWDNGNEVVYLYPVTQRLAQHHSEAGDLGKSLQVYDDELAVLSTGIPHYSYRFVAARVPLELELGTRSPGELQAMLEAHRTAFLEQEQAVEHPGRKDLFRGLAARMTSAIRHLELAGRPAPGFRFTRAYNAELPFTLESLRGKSS